jgi:hypothetical protein
VRHGSLYTASRDKPTSTSTVDRSFGCLRRIRWLLFLEHRQVIDKSSPIKIAFCLTCYQDHKQPRSMANFHPLRLTSFRQVLAIVSKPWYTRSRKSSRPLPALGEDQPCISILSTTEMCIRAVSPRPPCARNNGHRSSCRRAASTDPGCNQFIDPFSQIG